MEWDRNIQMAIVNVLMLSICILLFKKRNILGSYRNYMIGAMVLTYVIDSVNFYIRLSTVIDRVYSLYIYIYGLLGFFFFLIFLMYQKLIKDKVLNNISKIITIIFLLFFLFQVFNLEISEGFPKILIYFNVFLLLFVTALFLLDTFKTDLILEIKYYYPFWFSMGLIIIYLCVIPSIIISDMPDKKMTYGLWSTIVFFINILGYGIIFVGLFKAKKLD